MTYDVRIGEAVADPRAQIAPDDTLRGTIVEMEYDAQAPAFPYDERTGRTNCRVMWYELVKATGLEDLFFDGGRDFPRHLPVTRPLTPAHVERVAHVRARWEAEHPGAVPGWHYQDRAFPALPDDRVSGRDPHLARLLWLEWWMRRALQRCRRPAVHLVG